MLFWLLRPVWGFFWHANTEHVCLDRVLHSQGVVICKSNFMFELCSGVTSLLHLKIYDLKDAKASGKKNNILNKLYCSCSSEI